MNHTNLEASAKEAKSRYYREWRKKNPDKLKQYNQKFWAKKARELEKGELDGGNQKTNHADSKGNS